MAYPGVLEPVRSVHHRPVVQQVPKRVLCNADRHVRVQFRERVAGVVQSGPLVLYILVDADGRVRQDIVVRRVLLPDRRRVRMRAEHVQIQGDHQCVRGVHATVTHGTPPAQGVFAGRGGHVPGHHRAHQRDLLVLLVPLRAQRERVAVRLPAVHVRPESEHVLHRDAVCRAVFQGVHQV